MNIFIVFQQMLVLLVMIAIGFWAYKGNWIDDVSYGKISKIVVNILNPCIIIYGVMGKDSKIDGQVILHNLVFAVAYFVILIVLSWPLVKLLRFPKPHENVYRLMLIFANVGFMGIPVVSSIYGQEAIILIAFYTLGYNILLYSYGICLASAGNQEEILSKKEMIKRMINPGILSCIVAIIIFSFRIPVADSVCTFFNYMGNAAIPFSMLLIGASLARGVRKEFFTDIRFYIFIAIKMLVIPIAIALIMRTIPYIQDWEAVTKGVFLVILSMPVGSIVVMLAKECGADEMECTKGSILSTLLSVITIPIVAVFLPF